jgi:hypothetical protein
MIPQASMHYRKRLLNSALAALLTACASPGALVCSGPESTAVQDTLYFGTVKADGLVSARQWENFLDTVVTARFPSGYTFWLATGRWRTGKGQIIQEPTYVLTLIHSEDDDSESAIGEIIRRYKSEFSQEAVLRIRNGACKTL